MTTEFLLFQLIQKPWFYPFPWVCIIILCAKRSLFPFQKETESTSNPDEDNQNEDSGSETFSEEVEPRLKYRRLVNDVADVLSKDVASCIAVHPRVILEL